MKRRTLLKLLSLLPFAGPVITKALAKSNCKLGHIYTPYIPEPFPKWNKAVEGLEEAGKWALDIERSLLPQGIMFPRKGQIWEAVRDCEVNWVAFIPRTILPAGRVWLQHGERVRILTDEPRPIHVHFEPVRDSELHIVPQDIRNRPGYQYYWLSLRIAKTPCCLHEEPGFFHELFRLVEG